jgi:LacI family transcriptional regulator
MKPPRTNIRKIAREAGVSIATISRVLNGKSGVSEENRRKVQTVLSKHHYVLDSHLSKSRKVAVLCGSTAFGNYQSGLLEGLFSSSIANVISPVMIFKDSAPGMTALELVREQQCAGVIVDMPHVFKKDLEALAESELPVILTDETMQREGLGYINHDAYAGSLEAARHLIDLGHRRIGYVKYGIQTSNHEQRLEAYQDSMNAAGLELRPEWIVKTTSQVSQWEGAYLQTKELLKQAPEITAIMASNDNLAEGVIKAVFDLGKKVPDDISVIGFDNYPYTAYLHPALTTVHHPTREIGYLAAEAISLYFKNPNDSVLPRKTLPTQLILRDSVCTLNR